MNLSLRAVALSLAFSISAFTGATSAKADSFTFSFTNVVGTVNGTVTGEIIGLTNNATGSAAQILITSFPSGLNSIFGSGPINATSWDQQMENSFTEAGGVITAADFWSAQTVGGFSQGAQLFINGEVGSGFNFLNLDGTDDLYVWGDNGFQSVTFAPLAATTPEPSSLLLAVTGIAAAMGSFRRRLHR